MSASAYEAVLKKYEWAKKHVDQFEAATDLFRNSHPHTVATKVNGETGEVTYFVDHVPSIPDEVSFALGDAIHNLRGTLDHLVCALVSKVGRPCKNTSFPIFDDSEGFQALLSSKVPGLGQACLEVFRRVQPYKNGWGHTLRQLHRLDIIDKHRLLLSVCSMNTARTAIPSEVGKLSLRNPSICKMDRVLLPVGWLNWDEGGGFAPLNAGDVLKIVPASEAHESMGFAFDIALNEPEIALGEPTFMFLRNASRQVFRIIESFGPHF